MARPKKIGLDYSPQDVDIHDDPKIKKLIKEFGATGYLVYDYIKCRCYRVNGYWIGYDDDFCSNVAMVLGAGITGNSALEILKGCFRMSLFNKEVFKAFRIITSRGIQLRFLEVRKGCSLEKRLDLVNNSLVNDQITPGNDDDGTQRKVNEMKEKESKLFLALTSDWGVFAEKHKKAKILELTEKRKIKLKKRLSEKNFDLQKILLIADKSEFITGETGGWFTFDWVIESESNYLKVLEGNYNHEQNGTRQATPNNAGNKGQQPFSAASVYEKARQFDNEP